MKKILSALFSFVLVVSLVLPFNTVMAEDVTAKVKFDVADTQDGIVELSVTVADANIFVFQTALRYNKDVLVPVDAENEATDDFESFIVRNENTEAFSEIGMSLDAEHGLFGFTFYIMPGTRNEKIVGNEYVTDSEGTELCRFRFKKITDGEYGFEIAYEDDTKPYQAALKEGIIFTTMQGNPDLEVTFNINGTESVETIIPEKAPEVYVPKTSAERKSDVICLMIDRNMTVTYGAKKVIDEENSEVVPYIENERTLVPLRFIAEALGAQVLWESGWNGCIIEKDGKKIEITFGSNEFKVDGDAVVYDAPIEVVKDRTMVPVRFISEELGCDVYWNGLNRAVVISPADNAWVEDRGVEITALNEMMLTIVGIL